MVNTSAKKPDLERVVSKIDDVATLPQVLKKILEVTSNPNSGASDLQNILVSDMALTGKLLKVANSSYYGLREKVVNVKRAVVYLGFKTVKSIALAASVFEMMKLSDQVAGYSHESLWEHCVAVAVCAKSISQRAGLPIGEDVFAAAILHDIGIVIEDQYLHTDFLNVMNHPDITDKGLLETEKALLGFDHCTIGAAVARKWRIPDEISRVIEYHHQPEFAPEPHKTFVSIVFLADVICTAKKIGFSINPKIDRESVSFAMNEVGFQKKDVTLVLEDLPGEIEKVRDTLFY